MYKISSIFIVVLSILLTISFENKQLTKTPQSTYNKFKTNFEKLIADKNIQITNLNLDTFNHKINFIQVENDTYTQVILSDQKDIWLQLNVLQKINKMVKIKNSSLHLVDLSLKHPYATIKNN